jgi:hypothetical protein
LPAPFDGLIDSVLSLPGGPFAFDGSVDRGFAASVWSWLQLQTAAEGSGAAPTLASLCRLLRRATAQASIDPNTMRRLRAAIGGGVAIPTCSRSSCTSPWPRCPNQPASLPRR